MWIIYVKRIRFVRLYQFIFFKYKENDDKIEIFNNLKLKIILWIDSKSLKMKKIVLSVTNIQKLKAL